MMQKIMKCGLIGGFILFVWSAVSWTILPWQKSQLGSFTNEKDVRSAIIDNTNGSGLYILPNLNDYSNDSDELAAAKSRMMTGPFVVAAVAADGKNPNMVLSSAASLIVKIIAASLVTWLLFHIPKRDYNRSVKFVTVAGIVIAMMSTLPYAIWFAYPGSFVITSMIESIFGWFFAGLAIAKCDK
ncbi:MAG: hypothetical protein ACRENF_04685 [Thermodesulfobacteriota bacterium]